ncbi:MAG: GntR family transcriptional regulator [Armatimonadota bacterium]|nr:GntR family transcriptional regulator [Armatimonadota bacterium]MDR7428197.1 GntR family transcriptional regulator [Armatimonadota bacterium]MDR7469603.1 GntR family transcriptional regulator [Armatimonadota bacterium]MDR7475789.1 GntR family transcriptional regulator [Armatimonadota bacterium]MDR7538323.1 GntR family transcriptional regulator [Armatimonadota bacterium]
MTQLAQLTQLKKLFERGGLRGEVIYRTLREAIVRSILPEGYRLQDRTLAATLGVSRTPVRQAMQRLEAEGFLEGVPRLGAVVASITPQDVEDIYAIRIAQEGVAAQLAAQRASPGELELLQHLNDQIAEATRQGDHQHLSHLNQEFHEAIYRAARNTRLGDLLKRLQYSIQRFEYSTLSSPERAQQALQEHRDLLAAIVARDAEGAEAAARRHKENAMRTRLKMHGPRTGPGGRSGGRHSF